VEVYSIQHTGEERVTCTNRCRDLWQNKMLYTLPKGGNSTWLYGCPTVSVAVPYLRTGFLLA